MIRTITRRRATGLTILRISMIAQMMSMNLRTSEARQRQRSGTHLVMQDWTKILIQTTRSRLELRTRIRKQTLSLHSSIHVPH